LSADRYVITIVSISSVGLILLPTLAQINTSHGGSSVLPHMQYR